MDRPLFYDREGIPISDTMTWSRLMRYQDYKRVGLDRLPGYRVSTVWLGLDQGFPPGPPLIFETMVFREGEGDPIRLDMRMMRYATLIEAGRGHKRMVELVRAALGDDDMLRELFGVRAPDEDVGGA
jgi:hypothetical protein